MKIKLFFAAISFLFLVSFVGNKKAETVIGNTDPKEQLLTKYTWEAEEIRAQLSNNTTAYYKRGSEKNTVDYDFNFLKFNSDHSGVYSFKGDKVSTKWRFLDPEKTKMELIINYPSPLEIHLEYINISEKYFTYTQYATDSGIEYLASGTRTPVECNTGDEVVIK
jgi:hypothetical protein